jgi:uncharacterized protein (TIGR03382 family)
VPGPDGGSDCDNSNTGTVIKFSPTQPGTLSVVANFDGASSNTITWTVGPGSAGGSSGTTAGSGTGGTASGTTGGTGGTTGGSSSGTSGSGGNSKGGCSSGGPGLSALAPLLALLASRRRRPRAL